MRAISFFIAFMACCGLPLVLKAQTTQQDSLINALHTRTDTARVNLLNKLSSSYWYSDTKKTFIYARQALDLAEEIQYEQGKAAASNNMGAGYYQQNRYTEALQWYEKAVASHKNTGNFRGEAFVTTNIGMIYWKRGEFPMAVEYYLKALKIWEDHGVVAETSSVFDNLGNIYNEQEQFDTALVYYQKSIGIQKQYPKPPTEISMTLSNTGTAYLGKGDHANALDYFLQSLKILNPEDKESRAVSLSNVGLTYIEMKDFPKAFKYLQEALQLQSEIGDQDGKIHTLLGLAQVSVESGSLKRAAAFANEAIGIARTISDRSAMDEAWLMLSEISVRSGDYKSALESFKNHIAARDSIGNRENVFRIAKLQAGLETERKQAELDLLKKTTEVQRFRRNVIVAGLVALLLIASLIVSRQRLSIRKNNQLIAVNQQLTKQSVQLEEQARKLQDLDKMKSAFFANISHEFRTPLTLILNSLHDKISSLSLSEDPETVRGLQIMDRNAKRLLNLVNQLLDLSKLEAGEMRLNPVDLDLNKFLSLICSSFTSLSVSRGIDFKVELPSEPQLVRLDSHKTEDILYNLLSNAFKFTPAGGLVSFSAEIINGSPDKNIRIRVSDSGPGVGKEELPFIFNRFYQGQRYYADVQGTGIGLALTKELIELQEGKISVDSQEGAGANFTVDLPFIPATAPELFSEQKILEHEYLISDEAETGKIDDAGSTNDRPCILVVEDNQDLREYIFTTLKKDYRVLTAENGVKGLEKSMQIIPDLIISDWMMPEMDGLVFCQKIKEDQRTSHVPVILLTAVATEDARIRGLESGADDYLTKPFDTRELLTRVRNLIETRKQLRDRFSRELYLGPKKTMISSMDEKFLEKVMETIETFMGEPDFSMEKFGQEVGLSRMQLHRKLKALTGQSPGDFLRSMRLKKAKRLLEAKAGNVSEIGYEVGFNNLSYFSKAYREEFGISPSESVTV